MKQFVMIIGLLAMSIGPATADPRTIDVKKTATCGCCQAWVNHLKSAGFNVKTSNMAMGQLMRFKIRNGITEKHASCHTARLAGYTIEGHVPAREIRRLLEQRPDAVGLSVPGMPIGSPGMEVGNQREAYSVLLLKKDGTTEVFARYDAKE